MALFLVAVMLASCSRFPETPMMNQEDIMQTAISTVSTAFAETQRAVPTATATPMFFLLPTMAFATLTPSPTRASPTPLPTIPAFTPLVFSDSSIPLSERVVYYYLVNPAEHPMPQ